ncbi:hypothetical protein [Nonomuraea pusilla]|uniref:hypothetical protein n=1 Tax=Nonomuraea pusilla TaxID=46177 RepID=UPI000B81813B|nr:hypothetical protein [Nonomuraea pusilla]
MAAMHARREQEFFDVCVGFEDRLEAAKEAYVAALDGGDDAVLVSAAAELKAASEEMHGFRSGVRTLGRPKEGVPGRDATIMMGGAVNVVER